MLLTVVILFCMKYEFVFPYVHQKPIAKTVWPENCAANSRVLNDCNWCVCVKGKFVCKARVCNEIDMFGHFNDQIREYVVGMEGHGSWRSNGTVCTPRAHYQREGLLCVCDDDGNWPSPVCRDLFRVLHEVELTGHSRPSALHECTPRLLYLYGCNVCVCPPEGRINPDSCTRYNCSDNDPILLPAKEIKKHEDKYDLSEVYAECELQRKYIVGCRKCVCLKNNRLLCDNCENELTSRAGEETYCDKADQDQVFNIECNMCVCDERRMMYCTTRRCLKSSPKLNVELSKSADMTLRSTDPPIDHMNCIVGTKYKVECNVCFCDLNFDGKKTLSCTLKSCRKIQKPSWSAHALELLKNDCVDHTEYEKNCLLCRCDIVDGVKRESCIMKSECIEETSQSTKTKDLDLLHGYCEPSHLYKKDCNRCKCLSDGKVASCTSRVCPKAPEQPLVVDVIPVRQSGSTPCPRDHMYKVDCNYCFCLSNGNFLCTTANCDEQNK